ncbi:MAG: hypothetical protein KAG99_07055 [Bacteroidales bacterium]|nr:hypothetical protein [Bacteroidales bacterium]
MKYLVDDLFLNITLYDNKINGANYKKTKDGNYIVELDVEILKYYADSVGNQTDAPLNDYIYVALMDEEGDAFYYQKHKFTSTNATIQLVTDQIPATAGIDPYFVLIDREMDNNECDVKEADDSLVSILLNLPIKSAL